MNNFHRECILAFLFFITDRIMKYIALFDHSYEIFSWCAFAPSYNTGVALSFFQHSAYIKMLSLSTAFSFFIFAVWHATAYKPLLGSALILAGALSNSMDRLFFGAVIDYITIFVGSIEFPIFNIADLSIVFGIVLLMNFNTTYFGRLPYMFFILEIFWKRK